MLSYLTINLGAVEHNIKVVRSYLEPETKIMAVVKANAYGHGLVEVARAAWASGAEMLGVGSVDEGIALRIAKIRAPILVMGYTDPSEYHRVVEYSLQVTLFNREEINNLGKVAASNHSTVRVHLKIDTGMHRLGINPDETADFVAAIKKEPYLLLEAIFSHFAEVQDRPYAAEQIKEMQSALFTLQRSGSELPLVHMANSSGIVLYPESHFDMVRPGIAIYGLSNDIPELKPALSWHTKIVQTKRIAAGQKVGYGLTYETQRIGMLAVLPVGYADGYARSMSNKAEVLISGKRVRVVGRVCMSQTILDITGVQAKVGDEVVLIGESGHDTIKVQELAAWAETNPHEIVARLNPNLSRRFIRSESE
jgi:alanine racemase